MPTLPSTSLLATLVARNTSATNATALQVVCAWPLSDQYGPGLRFLYYTLIAACFFTQKAEWLRNACLAAVLLFPAVAALHGIVLAAVHVNNAVDMDIYGAFQICSMGILAAPITIKLSRMYLYYPGRTIIFLWTLLILAGLLSLTVEFFRIQTSACTGSSNTPMSSDLREFPYSSNPTCGLTCSVTQGPYSSLRGGSANNIYVIPAPDRLTFGAAALLAAACCIPSALWVVSMSNKIIQINWTTRFGNRAKDIEVSIEGTNGATIERMRVANTSMKLFLRVVEILVFIGAVFAVLVIGEINFFSAQVNYQTVPMANIGK
ncbi:hypothetical protein N431DRAFT_497796 [Stipitochalara longipes BDJ]|nr:hypothetical protein N431DRAFT_497796 [Stipitochalara longipes BDJ]